MFFSFTKCVWCLSRPEFAWCLCVDNCVASVGKRDLIFFGAHYLDMITPECYYATFGGLPV